MSLKKSLEMIPKVREKREVVVYEKILAEFDESRKEDAKQRKRVEEAEEEKSKKPKIEYGPKVPPWDLSDEEDDLDVAFITSKKKEETVRVPAPKKKKAAFRFEDYEEPTFTEVENEKYKDHPIYSEYTIYLHPPKLKKKAEDSITTFVLPADLQEYQQGKSSFWALPRHYRNHGISDSGQFDAALPHVVAVMNIKSQEDLRYYIRDKKTRKDTAYSNQMLLVSLCMAMLPVKPTERSKDLFRWFLYVFSERDLIDGITESFVSTNFNGFGPDADSSALDFLRDKDALQDTIKRLTIFCEHLLCCNTISIKKEGGHIKDNTWEDLCHHFRRLCLAYHYQYLDTLVPEADKDAVRKVLCTFDHSKGRSDANYRWNEEYLAALPKKDIRPDVYKELLEEEELEHEEDDEEDKKDEEVDETPKPYNPNWHKVQAEEDAKYFAWRAENGAAYPEPSKVREYDATDPCCPADEKSNLLNWFTELELKEQRDIGGLWPAGKDCFGLSVFSTTFDIPTKWIRSQFTKEAATFKDEDKECLENLELLHETAWKCFNFLANEHLLYTNVMLPDAKWSDEEQLTREEGHHPDSDVNSSDEE